MSYLSTHDLWTELEDLRAEAQDPDGLSAEYAERLAALETLADEIGGDLIMRDEDAGPMIPVGDFQGYAQELAEELDMVPTDHTWPTYCIDWEWAARELAHDYSIVTWQGEDYYVRSM